jgi:CDP-glycerol glycerophosphotransferase
MKGTFGQHKNIQRNFIQTTHLLSPNSYTTEKLLSSHDLDGIYAGKVLETGYPRVDTTLLCDKEKVKKKLTLESDKPILLFAPTWRGEVGKVESENEKLLEDLQKICLSLESEYEILFRGHSLMQKYVDNLSLPCSSVPNNIDTNELLSTVDFLITDYSSILFDYLPLNKPIALYVHDKEQYERERGFYFSLDEIPAYKCTDVDSLVKAVLDSNWHDKYKKEYLVFKNKYLYLDDGAASTRVINAIFNGYEEFSSNVDDEKENILIYCGGFRHNGITTSALNLFNYVDYDKYNLILIEGSDYHQEKEVNLKKLNAKAKVIFRCGQCNTSKQEIKELRNYFATGKLPLPSEVILDKHFNREMSRLFGETKFSTVVDFSGYVKFWTLMFRFSNAPRKVIYQHNDMLSENDKKINGKFKHRQNFKVIFELYKHFDNIVSVSRRTRDLNFSGLQTKVPDSHNKFNYVTNSIDYKGILEKSQQICTLELTEKTYPMPNKKMTNFIHVGRFSPEKCHDKLLKAFKKLNNEKPESMLYLVGDGILFHQTKKLVTKLGLSQKVIVTGHIDNPYALINHCDCLVLASDHEGQPMVLLEALVLEKPVISTDIIGSRSVLGDEYGQLVSNDADGLYHGMLEFINNKSLSSSFDYISYQTESMGLFYKEVCGSII